MGDYLKSTGRSGIASASEAFKAHLTADEGCKYDQVSNALPPNRECRNDVSQVVEIDLSTLEPHINGPFTPDLATPISQFKSAAAGDVKRFMHHSRFFHVIILTHTSFFATLPL